MSIIIYKIIKTVFITKRKKAKPGVNKQGDFRIQSARKRNKSEQYAQKNVSDKYSLIVSKQTLSFLNITICKLDVQSTGKHKEK